MIRAGKRAVVTGASQGLGLRIAEEFAREGAAVVMCARSGKDLEAAATAIRDAAPQATVISAVADVSKAADVRRLADTVTSALAASTLSYVTRECTDQRAVLKRWNGRSGSRQ